MSSHSGLWRHCRNTIIPTALPDARVVRNFTSIAFVNSALINDAKTNISQTDYIQRFLDNEVTFPLTNFTNSAKEKMFAHWVRNDQEEFVMYKKLYKETCCSSITKSLFPIESLPIVVNPVAISEAEKSFGRSLQKVLINSTLYYFVIPEQVQNVIFESWNQRWLIPKLLWPYARDLDMSAYTLNEDNIILQLIPPKPPRRGRLANGYEYNTNSKN